MLLGLALDTDRAAAVNGGQTIFVNKYSPNGSGTAGCEDPDFTEIGSDWPNPSGAVGAAVSGDTIFICGSPDADSNPYRPNGGVAGVPVGTKNLTFAGDGPGQTIIDGEGVRTQFFTTDSGSYLNLRSMTVRNGFDINTGGAVEAGGRVVSVEDVHFLGNEAIGFGAGGGAIYAGSVNVSNSVFRDNRAARSDPGFGLHKGGAIYAEGSVSTEGNSEFRNNSADGSGGAIYANGSGDDPGLISVTDTVFLENSTDFGSGGSTFSKGPTSVDGSVFEDSVAGGQSGGDSGPGDGGAVWAGGSVEIVESLFEGNSTPGIARSGVGGAVASVEGIAIDRSDFVGNSARQWGGALSAGAGVEIGDTGFQENEVTGEGSFGGAIYAQSGPPASTIEGSTFSDNSADSYAGAIRTFATALRVTNSTFNANQASAAPAISSSNDVRLESVTSSGNLGAYVISSGGDLTIGGSIIDETGEACVAPEFKINLGGNVISDTTASGDPSADCNPFVGETPFSGGGGPANKVDPATIALQPLTDNGGPTETMALGPGSVAAKSVTGARPATDQRGVNRPTESSASPSSSGAYQPVTPTNNTLPEISGNTRVGQALSTSNGSWSGSPAPTFTYQWQRCEPIAADTSPNLIANWGSFGDGDGQFELPMGVAIDSVGNVYVADSFNNRIQKFDAIGQFIATWGTGGTGNGEFFEPSAIAIDSANDVYVADVGNQRVQKFTSSGTYLTQWGTRGTGNSEFEDPYGIAVDGSGNVYVADAGNDRIQKFTSSGTYLAQWGSPGSGDGELNDPTGIATDRSGDIYVADSDNDRIQKFSSSGTYLTQWGSNGTGNGQFRDPLGLATDPAGDVYVADSENNRIQKFTSSGVYLTQWSTFLLPPDGTTDTFLLPTGVATNAAGDVYVADTNNQRVLGFDLFNCIADVTATNQTYTLTGADLDKYIRVSVTATNPDGSQTVFSNLTAQIQPAPPTPPGKPKLKVSFAGPGKVRAGKAFTTRIAISNKAKSSGRSLRINGNSPTSATDLKSCLTLPKAMVPVKAKGATVRGRKLCWSKASLSAGKKVNYAARIKVTRSAGRKETRKGRPATLRASVTASNLSGGTFRASGSKTVKVTPAQPRRPKPITG